MLLSVFSTWMARFLSRPPCRDVSAINVIHVHRQSRVVQVDLVDLVSLDRFFHDLMSCPNARVVAYRADKIFVIQPPILSRSLMLEAVQYHFDTAPAILNNPRRLVWIYCLLCHLSSHEVTALAEVFVVHSNQRSL